MQKSQKKNDTVKVKEKLTELERVQPLFDDALPERRTVIKVITCDSSIFFCHSQRLDDHFRRSIGKCGKNSSSVKVPNIESSKNIFPINSYRF